MDYELSEDQHAILGAMESLLEAHAGPARAISLAREGAYDGELHRAIRTGGFDGLVAGEGTGPLEAALALEAVARHAGVVSFGACGFVLPAVFQASATAEIPDAVLSNPLALIEEGVEGPVRFAPQARHALVLSGESARLVALSPDMTKAVRSNFGYPLGVVEPKSLKGGDSLPTGSGETLRNWWRLSLAVEAVGTMSGALAQTTSYLKDRKQFGRAIASFQAVQHRLAECAIALEGSRWLARETAYHGAGREEAATAASYAMTAAGQVFAEMHQLSGAIGFTHEHDLHVWTMRLQALRAELGGLGEHRRALAAARWGRVA